MFIKLFWKFGFNNTRGHHLRSIITVDSLEGPQSSWKLMFSLCNYAFYWLYNVIPARQKP